MKIFDMHIHAKATPPNPVGLLSEMDKAGVFGGCVFSTQPKEQNMTLGLSFEERLTEVLSWTKGFEQRLFPILWIHPKEENVIPKLRRAVDAGIVGFKMICANYYVYDEACLKVLREIARLGKPVIFHSGILWDGEVSSSYNRPLNWEALLKIDGLRFSMGHCSWPWIDECIALYGKFLNARTYHTGGAEMFFDITPGTPEIYRKELLTKLYNIGYDIGDNIMFGTDCVAHEYSSKWASEWLKLDGDILDGLGVCENYRQKLYSDNLLRFLGLSSKCATKTAPMPDNANTWSPVNPKVPAIIEKWYKRLSFPKRYDKEFYKALKEIKISDTISPVNYDTSTPPCIRNLLSYLYMCEEVSEKYAAHGIPEKTMLDTLGDIVVWANEWSEIKGEFCLGEIDWLVRHVNFTLFRLGRLQFAFGNAEEDFPTLNVKKGTPVIEIHIPADGKLDREECDKSIALAKDFFAKHFPEYEYAAFTCHSWLLDDTLKKYLSEGSNIISFGDRFTKVKNDDSYAIVRYIFRWDTNEFNLKHAVANGGFAERIKRAVLDGETFHETLGGFKKN